MREIKFRIRDGEDMLFFDDLREMDFNDYCDFNKLMDRIKPLMQFTGLKDKDGHEVYEGDIINCTSGCPHLVEFRLEHGGNVLGGMPTFYLSGLNPGYQRTGKEEIIGNIYENENLLK